ncbi:MAG: hypothetical protein R2695_20035 [Acidimicrobiales bacterium]
MAPGSGACSVLTSTSDVDCEPVEFDGFRLRTARYPTLVIDGKVIVFQRDSDEVARRSDPTPASRPVLI